MLAAALLGGGRLVSIAVSLSVSVSLAQMRVRVLLRVLGYLAGGWRCQCREKEGVVRLLLLLLVQDLGNLEDL